MDNATMKMYSFQIYRLRMSYFHMRLLFVLDVVLSLTSVCFNISAIFVLIRYLKLRSNYFKFLLSLSLSDCCLAVLHVMIPFDLFITIWTGFLQEFSKNVSYKRDKPVIQTFPAEICSIVYLSLQLSGLLTLMIIAVDLFIKVRKPLHYNIIISPRRANIIICFIWLVPISMFGIVFAIEEFSLLTYLSVEQYESIGSLIYFVVIYIIIFFQIRKRKHQSASRQYVATTKAAVTMSIIVTIYILCMMPMNWLMVLIVYILCMMPMNWF